MAKLLYKPLGSMEGRRSVQLYKEYLKVRGNFPMYKTGRMLAFLSVSTATDDMELVNNFVEMCGGLLNDNLGVMEIHIDGDFSDAVVDSILDFAEYWLGDVMDYIGLSDNSIIFGVKPEFI